MNLLSISYGMSIAWSSSSILILKSFETPLNNGIPMSDTQISWITSLLGLGGLVGSILAGSLADIFGRKKTLLALAIPQLVRSDTQIALLYVFNPTYLVFQKNQSFTKLRKFPSKK